MKTLALRNGDLVVTANGHATVSGTAMIVQDLRCALMEPRGTDRFHPGYGSALYDLLGQPNVGGDTSGVAWAARSEIVRVTSNYMAVQQDKLQRDALSGAKSRFYDGDVLDDVSAIEATADGDALRLAVTIVTGTGDTTQVAADITDTSGA